MDKVKKHNDYVATQIKMLYRSLKTLIALGADVRNEAECAIKQLTVSESQRNLSENCAGIIDTMQLYLGHDIAGIERELRTIREIIPLIENYKKTEKVLPKFD